MTLWNALSVRQPWAWLVVMGYKPVENRGWATTYRGPLLIHASRTLDPYDSWIRGMVLRRFGIRIPEVLPRGGIVGRVNLTDCTRQHPSPWHEPDQVAWVMAEARPLPFHRCPGKRGVFEIEYEEAT